MFRFHNVIACGILDANLISVGMDVHKESLIIMDILVQLSAFSSDKPADILKLINAYPEFRELHAEIAEFRKNPKELIV